MTNVNLTQRLFLWILMLYMSVLCMSNTIALRNVALALLCVIAIGTFIFKREALHQRFSRSLLMVPRLFWAWALFLILFPFWAPESTVAWANFRGQWLESLLVWFVAFAVVVLLGHASLGLWLLALASAAPALLHLLMVILAWIGFLPHSLPETATITHLFSYAFARYNELGLTSIGFPWGFRGLEPMHGNLGYSACQALVVFTAIALSAFHDRRTGALAGAFFGILACFACILIANSRGAILYSLLTVSVMAFVYFFAIAKRPPLAEYFKLASIKFLALFFVIFFCVFSVFAIHSVQRDSRWMPMADSIRIGLSIPDPTDLLCNGVSSEIKEKIIHDFSSASPQYQERLLAGVGGDGGRVLLMRTGMQLVLENPWGLDGSRDAFKKRMKEKCGHIPVLEFAHSHNGWFDTVLALGWLGGALYASLFVFFIQAGWGSLNDKKQWPFALALLSLALFWALRGMADSVYREHYLQMQAVMLGILYFKIQSEN